MRTHWSNLFTSIIFFLSVIGSSSAQQPGSAAYNSVFLPAHGVGDTQRGPERWGAFAEGKGDVIGWTMGGADEAEAKELAMAECISGGGRECEVAATFVNECAVLAAGPKDYGWSHGNRSMSWHRKRALRQCGDDYAVVREGCAIPGR